MKILITAFILSLSLNSFACGTSPSGDVKPGVITDQVQKNILFDSRGELKCLAFNDSTHTVDEFSAELDVYDIYRCMNSPVKADIVLEDNTKLEIEKVEKTPRGDLILKFVKYGASILCSKK